MGKIRGCGFEIKKTYRVFEKARHRFFICAKEEYGHSFLDGKTNRGLINENQH